MIGVALIKEAVKDEEIGRIYAVVRPGSKKICRLQNCHDIIVVECDVREYLKLPDLLPYPIDIFFHLAWPRTPTYEESYDDIHEKSLNLLGVLDALRAAGYFGCKTFIGAGSQSEYGIVKEGLISTQSPCNPVRADGVLHLAAGKLVKLLAGQMGINSAWLRVFSIYGINDRENSLVKSTIHKLLNGEHCSFTKCEQIWDYLYEEDAGKAFLLAGKKMFGNKTYNLGYGEPRPIRDYLESIRTIVSSDAELGIGELPYPKGVVMNLGCDNTDFVKDIGWQPEIGFAEGVKRILDAELEGIVT